MGGQCHTLFALPQERDSIPIVQEAGQSPESVWMGAENLASARI
jgi:hypothetical protein